MGREDDRRKLDRETTVFLLFFLFMAGYYVWRMFALTPWYDELYTYYFFISRGPVYAAIHWPLPNNHIGYSVLSACLGIFGSPAVALRGISCTASLGSLALLFAIGRKCIGRGYALVPVFLYGGMKLVNQLAVQGRGYAFVTFCYLLALWELIHIAAERRDRVRDHLIFGASLVAALYAIPSSVYVVVPVCVTGGVLLLRQREYGRLVRLILTSAASAVCTAGLYGIVWLAIGSNLLVKTEGSAYYGMGHAAVILRAPFAALGTGIEYMLATPYIQSVGRDGFPEKYAGWLRNLMNEYYPGCALLLAVLLLLCVTAVLWRMGCRLWKKAHGRADSGSGAQKKDNNCYELFLECYLLCSILLLPLMQIVQCSLPYYRVFSFAGVVAALGAAWLLRVVVLGVCGGREAAVCKDGTASFGRSPWKYLPAAVSGICGILCVTLLLSPSYRAQYGGREAAIEDALRHIDWTAVERVAVTDCDQEYLLLFLYGIGEDGVTRQPSEADVVLADRYLLLEQEEDRPEYGGDAWKLYTTREAFAQFLEETEAAAVYENERFVLYQ